MKPGQIRPLYLEPRLHKQSVKQKINNHGTCLARPLHTLYTQKNVWQTIGPPSICFHLTSMRELNLDYIILFTFNNQLNLI
jgi:hypothetical protein